MKNEMKNEEAVSPVIATILMVAITVVLAGVLYVWASSLAGDSTGDTLDTYVFTAEDAAQTQTQPLRLTTLLESVCKVDQASTGELFKSPSRLTAAHQ